MKPKIFFSYALLILTVFIFLTGCTTTKTPMQTDNIDELIGTWANPENNYSATFRPMGKFEFMPNRTFESYYNADDTLAVLTASFEVKEKWKDRKGLIYFDTIMNLATGKSYSLIRVNKEADTLEMMYGPPGTKSQMKFDTSAGFLEVPSYHIWYRQ